MNVTRSRWFHLLSLVLMVLLLNGACGDENRFLLSIQLSPTGATIDDVAPNNTVQFLATGIYSKGSNADLTSTATWSSSQTAVATVNSSGLVTAVPGACDSTVIRAVQDNIVATATVSVC